jgi:hypothetical protein
MMKFETFRCCVVASMLLTFAPLIARAQTNSALLVTEFPKEQFVRATANAVFLEGGHAKDTDEDLRLSIYETQGMFRIKPGTLESPRIGYNFTYLDVHSGFDGLPDRLIDQSVAVGFPIAKYQDWIIGASVGVGYAGDSFFGDGDAYYGLGSLAAFKQFDDTSALVFVLDYDGNRTFLPDIPLPGVAYIKRIGDQLQMTLGLPVSSIRWEATEQLNIEIGFSIPDDVRVDIGYEVLPHVTLFGRGRQAREAFFEDGLIGNRDRIIFEQRRAEAGVRYQPCKAFNVDLAVGYAWGGEFSQGFDARDTEEITDISDEPYIRAGLELRY